MDGKRVTSQQLFYSSVECTHVLEESSTLIHLEMQLHIIKRYSILCFI